MATQFYFNKNLVVRTPNTPFEPHKLNEQHLKNILKELHFKEAIYLASPSLYEMATNWQDGAEFEQKKIDKLVVSLAKYYSRMMTRCTPFGLFAACSITQWGDDNQHKLCIDEQKNNRHTRFDMHFLSALAQHLSQIEIVKTNLRYSPNTSLYYLGNEIRYVEYKYVNGVRTHQISSVVISDYLELILENAQGGATYASLIALLVGTETTEEEVKDFLDELIDAQLLVNSLEPSITGDEFLEQIIATIQQIYNTTDNQEIKDLLSYLKSIKNDIEALDTNKENDVQEYKKIGQKISEFGIPYEENKLFQTDCFKQLSGNISEQYQQQLSNALVFLSKLTPKKESANMASFAKRFYDRFEDKEIALLEVLDTETGLGYLENSSTDISPLIEGIALQQENNGSYSMEWNNVETWLYEKLAAATAQNTYEVTFTLADAENLNNLTQDDMPPSMAVMFKVVEHPKKKNKCLLLESIGGSSAINLLGRFAHGNSEILATASQISEQEQAQNPDVIFAEIVHLPESRIGNILLHPVFRPYEIPYLSRSSVIQENQIALSDLYVSVKSDKVVLKSKRLNKEIIPRLSTAHNFTYKALPVYQFLGDLQTQSLRYAFGFHWGNMSAQHTFLPRVVVDGVILHLATWQFKKSDLSVFVAGISTDAVEAFTNKWRLPQYVVLADGDNELFIDWQNALSINVFIYSIKNVENIVIKEFLYEKNATVANNKNAPFINQNIALLQRNGELYTQKKFTKKSNDEIQRTFSIGSEWLYFKLYCGSKIADNVLTEYIKPITEELFAKQLIDKWFFIRYADPDLHLRVRFHLKDVSKIGSVINCFHSHIKNAENTGYIWKTQADTYKRELERYDFSGIELAETFFYKDSEATLEMLNNTWGDNRENVRWLWGIRAIDDLLDGFRFSIEQRLHLLEELKNGFYAEFKVDVLFKKQLDKKYRDYKSAINAILDKRNDAANEIYPLLKILTTKKEELTPVFTTLVSLHSSGVIGTPINQLLGSYIHMLVNRLIPANQRLHELLIYDFMYRTYQSLAARSKQPNT